MASSDRERFPAYCHAIWKLGNGKGKELCERNMCWRADRVFPKSQAQTLLCHAGLTTDAAPMAVEGGSTSVVQYGAYVVDDEAEAATTGTRAAGVGLRLLGKIGEAPEGVCGGGDQRPGGDMLRKKTGNPHPEQRRRSRRPDR